MNARLPRGGVKMLLSRAVQEIKPDRIRPSELLNRRNPGRSAADQLAGRENAAAHPDFLQTPKGLSQGFVIRKIGLQEGHLQHLLHDGAVAVHKVAEDHGPVAGPLQGAHRVTADLARSAGDQNLRDGSIPEGVGRKAERHQSAPDARC